MAQLDRVLGKLKEAVGGATGDPQLKTSGKVDQAAGIAKDAVGKVAGAVKGAINSPKVQDVINSRKKQD